MAAEDAVDGVEAITEELPALTVVGYASALRYAQVVTPDEAAELEAKKLAAKKAKKEKKKAQTTLKVKEDAVEDPRDGEVTPALTCRDCGGAFAFPKGERKFYAAKGFATPSRCKPCRASKKKVGLEPEMNGTNGTYPASYLCSEYIPTAGYHTTGIIDSWCSVHVPCSDRLLA